MAVGTDTHWTVALTKMSACTEAVQWSRSYSSLQAAWEACERGDWMLWLLGRLASEPMSEARRPLVAAACECARTVLPIFEQHCPGDERPRECLEAAERFACGKPLEREVLCDAAADAADAAAQAAYAAAQAAYAAAQAAYTAAHAYAAAQAAYTAAHAHAAATTAATTAQAADADARTEKLREFANIVRRYYPRAPEL